MSNDNSIVSRSWCAYFAANSTSAEGLPWRHAGTLTSAERRVIAKSIQQFQLGEGAEGRRLLKRGLDSDQCSNDPHFVEALRLFIKEEQRHSTMLGRFMRTEGISALQGHWLDGIFRCIRVLSGLELELRVLVTAEVIAVPYYRALGAATKSELLGAICAVILSDEAAHLRFQRSILTRLSAARDPGLRCLITLLHRIFLLGTCCVIWLEHRRVFCAAGYSFGRFVEQSLSHMSALEAPVLQTPRIGAAVSDC